MGDQVGLLVLLGVIVVMAGGFALTWALAARATTTPSTPTRTGRCGSARTTPRVPSVPTSWATRPSTRITTEGWGGARPGEGAEPEELPEDVHPEQARQRPAARSPLDGDASAESRHASVVVLA